MGNWVVGIILGPNIKIRGSRITLAYLDTTIMKIGSGPRLGSIRKKATQYANLSNAAQPQPLDRFQLTYKKLQVSVFCVRLIAQI